MQEKKMVALFVSVMTLSMLTTMNASQVNEITCNEAEQLLMPCAEYLVGSGPATPSDDCCKGGNTVFQRANTTQNRRDLCKCFKDAAGLIDVNPDRAKQLPTLCKINLPFPLDPNVDCSKIPYLI